jgi:hypothetical protein
MRGKLKIADKGKIVLSLNRYVLKQFINGNSLKRET